MKQCLMMQKIKEYNLYQFAGSKDWRFIPLTELFSPHIRSGRLIEWFESDNLYFSGSSFVAVDKEGDFIKIYNLNGECMFDENDHEDVEFLKQKFTMTKNNFSQIIYQWEELRVTRPDIILVVIHEDNHVTLETNPKTIKEYQDASYAFDINTSKN
jgi:hypothetical protein